MTVKKQGTGSRSGFIGRSIALEFLTSALPIRRVAAASTMALVIFAAVACSAGTGFSPAGAQNPPRPTGITVPDEIKKLDSSEVERRLGRLLADEGDTGLAAPVVGPTPMPDDLTLQEILDLLDSATAEASTGEIVISVGPETLSRLQDPVLVVKSAPSHGTATVISPGQVLYVPDDSDSDSDSFEYEIFDGAEFVISQVVEIRR